MIDAYRENRSSAIGRVGDVHTSVFDLNVDKIDRVNTKEDGEIVRNNILNSSDPVIFSMDNYVDVLYSLTGSELDVLQPFGPERELIFALGEYEVKATVGENQTVQFDSLEHLAKISVEDYLTIQLYTNNDAGNVLWEWAFTSLDVDIDSDNDDGYDEPERSIEEEEAEESDNHPGKIIDVNDGDINDNDIPDFAEFEYREDGGPLMEHKFVPFVVEIPAHVKIGKENSTLFIDYSGSDPNNVDKENVGTDDDPEWVYTAAPGSQRIWLINADEKREPTGIAQNGHYFTPKKKYKLLDLGFTPTERVKTFYIEGIRKTEAGEAKKEIVLEYEI